MVGLGLRLYFADGFNMFDSLIVVSGLVELVLEASGDGAEGGGALAALRSLRVLRVLKLAQSWVSLRIVLIIILETMVHIGYFAVLLILFVCVLYVCIGFEVVCNGAGGVVQVYVRHQVTRF